MTLEDSADCKNNAWITLSAKPGGLQDSVFSENYGNLLVSEDVRKQQQEESEEQDA